MYISVRLGLKTVISFYFNVVNILSLSNLCTSCIYFTVAVKVIHPGVRESIDADIQIMRFVASMLEKIVPGAIHLSLTESVDEFSKLMMRQVDLTVEAQNLDRFRNNFLGVSQSTKISFPVPLSGLVTTNVLVETFHDGQLMSDFLDHEGDLALSKNLRKRLAETGLDAILRMVFKDNFIHGDLHPGKRNAAFTMRFFMNFIYLFISVLRVIF